jgi:hypothetical protein
MLAFIVTVIVNGWQRRQHVKLVTEFNTRLLDRIGSVKDFSEFLQTPGGAQFLNTLTADRGPIGPRDRILRATQTGIVAAPVGLGFVILRAWQGAMDSEASDVFMIIGTILLSLGHTHVSS